MMGYVYERSWLNIAASAAEDGRTGFFSGRITATNQGPVKVQINWPSHRSGKYLCVPFRFKTKISREEPLGQRSWVYQERQLSPRTLHFTKSQLYWECLEHDACEMLPFGLPKTPHAWGGQAWKSLSKESGSLQRVTYSRSPDSTLDAYGLWDKIFIAYTTGNLTYNSDKLVALSGVAQKLQPQIQTDYLVSL
ncbi:hypothetical protein G7Y89_g4605 [Cudoniella acicularis]|uniref:Uncharacterized protein n=1 Tax=Cudoniella acicularis TaxID=354080 RepID=A0A8H4W4J6_9HELO|nr:hypothetical protein G7Y89_g4605 [Cudoniella acicularis]